MNEKSYLIPVEDGFLKEFHIAHKKSTLYRMHCEGENIEWFAKIGGKLFLDTNAYFLSATRKTKKEE